MLQGAKSLGSNPHAWLIGTLLGAMTGGLGAQLAIFGGVAPELGLVGGAAAGLLGLTSARAGQLRDDTGA